MCKLLLLLLVVVSGAKIRLYFCVLNNFGIFISCSAMFLAFHAV